MAILVKTAPHSSWVVLDAIKNLYLEETIVFTVLRCVIGVRYERKSCRSLNKSA